MRTVCLLFFLLLIILIRIVAPNRPHPRCCCRSSGKELIDVTTFASQLHIGARARSTREPIDRYRRIINMTVRYLKNLSFYATYTFKYKCTRKMYIVLLPLRTLRGMRNCQIVVQRVYFKRALFDLCIILVTSVQRKKQLLICSSFVRHAIIIEV